PRLNIRWPESRARCRETLDVLVKAWTQERFSHEGTYFQFRDVCVTPKPYQRPHPPIRIAATTQDTYPLVGRMGYPIFIAVRTTSIADLSRFIGGYHAAWTAAGHPGRGPVGLIVPVYVAASARRAREEPEARTMHFFRTTAPAPRSPSTRSHGAPPLIRSPYADRLATPAASRT